MNENYYRLIDTFSHLTDVCVLPTYLRKKDKHLRKIFLGDNQAQNSITLGTYNPNFFIAYASIKDDLASLFNQSLYFLLQKLGDKSNMLILCQKKTRNYGLFYTQYDRFAAKYNYYLQPFFDTMHKRYNTMDMQVLPIEIENYCCLPYNSNIKDMIANQHVWQSSLAYLYHQLEEQQYVRKYDLF